MADNRVSKGIILAAGDGDRFGELTRTIPKVLLPALGKPLIWYPIEALLRAGIREIAIVVGHFSDKIETIICRSSIPEVSLQYIFNPHHQGGNALSVATGGQWAAGELFVVCMGDHIMHQDYVARFLEKSSSQETLGVDFRPGNHHILEEATKVRVDEEGRISDIGKELTRWDGIDTGVFLLTENFVSAVRELHLTRGINIDIGDVIRFMRGRGQDFATVDTTGPFWADIDTVEALKLVDGAERWL